MATELPSIENDLVSGIPDTVGCNSGGSIAVSALSSAGMSVSGSAGGDLGDADIKNMDVISAVKLSLLQTLLEEGIYYDFIVTKTNTGAFILPPQGTGPTDVYYSVTTDGLKDQRVSSVTIVGRDPTPTRIRGASYNVLGTSTTINDADQMLSNCNKYHFVKYATKMYKEPLGDQNSLVNYPAIHAWTGPHENIIGWIHRITGNIPESAKLTHNDTTSVPVFLGRSTGIRYSKGTAADPNCAAPTECTGGIPVPIPDIASYTIGGSWSKYNGFLGISKVIVIGTVLDEIYSAPSTAGSTANPKIYGTVHDSANKAIELSQTQDYAVRYVGNDAAFICFADNKNPKDPANYNSLQVVNATPWSGAATTGQIYGASNVFLTSANQGIIIKEIWAVCEMDVPSISIFDKNGNASSILRSVRYSMQAIKVNDPPPPMAINGSLITQTSEGATEKAVENALNAAGPGQGVTLTLSFLRGSAVTGASSKLMALMGEPSFVEQTYMCGPRCNPELGGTGGGGCVNRITHSYSDQGTYTVSVNTGPVFRGDLLSIGNGPTPYAVETVSTKGSVTYAYGAYVNVRIDGYGTVNAVNCQNQVLRAGDRVQVTLHNNPVNA